MVEPDAVVPPRPEPGAEDPETRADAEDLPDPVLPSDSDLATAPEPDDLEAVDKAPNEGDRRVEPPVVPLEAPSVAVRGRALAIASWARALLTDATRGRVAGGAVRGFGLAAVTPPVASSPGMPKVSGKPAT
jgi:hypothetical protein